MKTNIVKAISIIAMFLACTSPVFATAAVDFPSCLNAQGTITAHYADGEHGIAGKNGLVRGEDTVYSIANGNAVQCFCPADGAAIQTNWLNASQLTTYEIKSYTYDGWILIPDGSVWGLSSAPYLARNISYTCRGDNDPGDRGSSSNNNSSSNNSSNNSSSSNSSSNSSSGTVLGIGGGDILGLASTGNIVFIYTLAVLGAATLIAGILWERKNKS